MPDAPAFRTIVIDPPWDYGATNARSSAGKHYPTMRNEAIAALPIAACAADSAHLYLWVTNPRIFAARTGKGPSPKEMMDAWGFRYQTTLTWLKAGALGMGFYFRGNTEHVLFGTRGRCPIPAAVRRRNWFSAPRGRHSAKPAAFYEIVEAVSPAPRLDVFARCRRVGWSAWGDEINPTGAIVAPPEAA